MPFEFSKTKLGGVVVIEPRAFADERGFFMETYKESDFIGAGINERFVQDNHSLSSRGVLRGLHFQTSPHAQGKLVRVISGSVWDVAVDLRPGSPTYMEWFGLELSSENRKMVYIPPGFAHGFLTLEDNTHFLYKCTAEYAPEADGGIRWNDPDIAVEWPLDAGLEPDVSEKDALLPHYRELS